MLLTRPEQRPPNELVLAHTVLINRLTGQPRALQPHDVGAVVVVVVVVTVVVVALHTVSAQHRTTAVSVKISAHDEPFVVV